MEERELTPKEAMDVIGSCLDNALEFGLEVEVIYQALVAMKKNPSLDPAQAMINGVLEWIK